MRTGRLTLKIYLYSIIGVLTTVGMVVATVITVKSEHQDHMLLASEHIARSLWQHQADHPEAVQAATTGATQSSRALVTVYDNGGRMVASTAAPPLPMPSQPQLVELREKGFVEVGHAARAHELRNDGGVVAIGVVKFPVPSPLRLAGPLLILLVVLLAVALIFARHLARPLEHVANVAKRFGRGDLSARVGNQRNDEIGEVGRSFDAMADRVADLMAAQQELMANVSHELLTPLSRIQVAVDLVTDGKSERFKDLVPDIAQDLAELERLIDDVMTVAKLDLSRSRAAGSVVPLRVQALSTDTLLQEAVSRFRSQHPTRELAVEIDPEMPEMSADAVLLRRVIDNLLENARKFSDHDTIIRLSARATRTGVTIAIADRGIGIDEVDVEHVFTPFFRSDKSRSRSTGGVGLGLALARRVVEAHGGTIAITSKPGQGATVTLALPAQPAAA